MKRKSDTKLSINRRRFLQAAGGAALTAFLPGIPSLRRTTGQSGHLKVGLLLPSSSFYPSLGKNFASGIQMYLENSGNGGFPKLQFINQETGVGPGKALLKARILIEEEGVDIITGILDPTLNPALVDLCREKRVLLIANHAGADRRTLNMNGPYVIQNSIHCWQSNLAMGFWAAQNIGRSAVVASSFYESGYDALYAFSQGFEQGGGLVLQTVINKKPDAIDDQQSPIISIKENKPELVFASYSGPEAVEFIRNYQDAGLSMGIPLITSGFTVDESILAELGSVAEGIKSCLSWAPDLENESNKILERSFQRKYGNSADIFAVMGYETGQSIEPADQTSKFY